jgi:hypothetical protein
MNMEKQTHNAASLLGILQTFEDGYKLSSADFYKAHVENDDDVVGNLSGMHRQAWAGFYAEWRRMSGSSFSARIERDLELA